MGDLQCRLQIKGTRKASSTEGDGVYLKVPNGLRVPTGALTARCFVATANLDPSKIILRATGVRRNLDNDIN